MSLTQYGTRLMAETRTLSALRVQDKDIKVLRSLLALSSEQIREPWSVSNDPDGNAAVVDVDDPEGEAMWEDLARGEVPAVALSRKRDFPARYVLHKPLRMSELMQVLDELSVAASGETERDAWRTMVLSADGDRLPLGEHLRRHAWTSAVAIELDDLPPLYIDAGSGAWFSAAGERQLSRILETRLGPRDARPLSAAELVEATEGMTQNNLANLKWRAGLAQSRGALHPDLAGEVRFMLPQVPLQALSDTAYSRQARVLLRGPMSADDLRSESRAGMEDVAEFLNACHACGFLLISRSDPSLAGATASG